MRGEVDNKLTPKVVDQHYKRTEYYKDNQRMRKIDLHIVQHSINVQYPHAVELDYVVEKLGGVTANS